MPKFSPQFDPAKWSYEDWRFWVFGIREDLSAQLAPKFEIPELTVISDVGRYFSPFSPIYMGMDTYPFPDPTRELPVQAAPGSAPALMDKRELSDWLHVCIKPIDNWLLEGLLPVIQPSPRIQRFNPAQVLAAMEQLHGRGHGYASGKRMTAYTTNERAF
ncbi:MAG: hypothetical protein R3F11_20850 [Verrucomicrobiales bacterium]